MSITLEKPEATSTQYPLTLTDRLPAWAKVSWPTMALVGCLGLLFTYLARQPLTHTDVFGHLAYGQWIWTHRGLPLTEPFMPLAAGIRTVDTAWFSQLLAFGLYAAWGYAGIQFFQATAVTLCVSLLSTRLYQRTHSLRLTFAGTLAMMLVSWTPLNVARPQIVGCVCFSLLLFLLTARRWGKTQWIAIPLVFLVWANSHGSFIIGLLTLASLIAGRAFDVIRATGRFEAPLSDAPFRRLFLVTELAVVATLVNPYGIRLYTDVLFFSEHPNLADLVEWEPLSLRSPFGMMTAVMVFALLLVYRYTPRRVPTGEALVVAVLLLASLWSQRMLVWWGPVAAGALVWNLHAILVASRGRPFELPAGESRWTLVTAALVWISFGFTPFALLLMHNRHPTVKETLSRATPIGAVDYLRKNPPQGQVFNTYEWGDYLLWAGPKNVQVFVASHVQYVPREVWRHYLAAASGGMEAQTIFDRYGVNTVLIDKYERKNLVARMKDMDGWELKYDDGLSVVYKRKKPI